MCFTWRQRDFQRRLPTILPIDRDIGIAWLRANENQSISGFQRHIGEGNILAGTDLQIVLPGLEAGTLQRYVINTLQKIYGSGCNTQQLTIGNDVRAGWRGIKADTGPCRVERRSQ